MFRYTTDISVYKEEFNNEVTYTGTNPGIESDIAEKKRVPFVGIPSLQTSRHGIADVMLLNCHEGLLSISGMVAVVDEILDAMRAQRNKLRTMTDKQSLTVLNHKIPGCRFDAHFINKITNYAIYRMVRLWDPCGHCRLLYAYFDVNRSKVQFTEVLDLDNLQSSPHLKLTTLTSSTCLNSMT